MLVQSIYNWIDSKQGQYTVGKAALYYIIAVGANFPPVVPDPANTIF